MEENSVMAKEKTQKANNSWKVSCFQDIKDQLQDIEARGQAKQSCFFLVLRSAQLPDVSIFRSGSISLYKFSIWGFDIRGWQLLLLSPCVHQHDQDSHLLWPKVTEGLGLHRSKPEEVREPEKELGDSNPTSFPSHGEACGGQTTDLPLPHYLNLHMRL